MNAANSALSPSALRARARRLLPHLVGTRRETLGPDLVAGLTVAAVAVPQSVAYALVAGVPPEMGLAAAALPCAAAALFGSSPSLVTGPTIPTALVLGSAVVVPALAAGADPVPAVLATALLAGGFLAVFGALGVGRAARFLADPVVAGFATGVGVLIAVGFVPAALGAEAGVAPAAAAPVPALLAALRDAAAAARSLDGRALALAAFVPVFVLGLRRLDSRLPAALGALAAATAAAHAFGWLRGADALAGLGEVHGALPGLAAVPLDEPVRLAPAALAIALVGAVQSIAAARALAARGAPRAPALDLDRELFAQGVGNAVSAVTGGIAVGGSLSRSAVARLAGGRSRLAPLASGVFVAAVLPFAGDALAAVPRAALAGLIVLSGIELVDRAALRRASLTPGDRAVLWTTLAATLSIDLVQAVYVGLFLSLLLLLARAGRLQVSELVHAGPGGGLREIDVDPHTGATPVVVLNLEGDLSFAVAGDLAATLAAIRARGPRVVILRLRRAHHLDATAIEALRQAVGGLREDGVEVLLCGLSDALVHRLEATELGELLGPDGLLREGHRLSEGLRAALERARRWLSPRADAEIFRWETGNAREGDPTP